MGLTLEGESYMGSGHSLRYEARAYHAPRCAAPSRGSGWVKDGSLGPGSTVNFHGETGGLMMVQLVNKLIDGENDGQCLGNLMKVVVI